MHSKSWGTLCAVFCAFALVNSASSQADIIENYDLTYQWTEVFHPGSHGSTYGTPILDGDTLKFGENSSDPHTLPLDFASLSSGAVTNSDFVDGKLILTITTKGEKFIDNLTFYEQGGWSFGPNGTSLTSSEVTFSGATIAVNGGSPFPVTMNFYDPPPGTNDSKIFRKTIDNNAGSWQGYFTADLGDGVTRVDLTFNNALATANEAGTSAFIDKKRVWIGVNDSFTVPGVPEPASLLMLGIAAAIGFGARRWIT